MIITCNSVDVAHINGTVWDGWGLCCSFFFVFIRRAGWRMCFFIIFVLLFVVIFTWTAHFPTQQKKPSDPNAYIHVGCTAKSVELSEFQLWKLEIKVKTNKMPTQCKKITTAKLYRWNDEIEERWGNSERCARSRHSCDTIIRCIFFFFNSQFFSPPFLLLFFRVPMWNAKCT